LPRSGEHDRGVTDEFIEPVVIDGGRASIPSGIRRSSSTRPPHGSSEKLGQLGVDLTTLLRYREDFDSGRLSEHVVQNTLAEMLEHGIRQLHAAETEKYAHVTYFLDGGREEAFPARSIRRLAARRAEPHHKPMSAPELADRVVRAVDDDDYGFVVVNFANPDMVGHTGVIPAVVDAVETADACLGRVVDAVERAGGVSLVIADHGNAETLLEEDGVSPHTAHTTNPVPVILTAPDARLRDGELAEVAPTVLSLLGLQAPQNMTQTDLFES
jgi:2,3-bisphosphoglycerate-independent phosphoglycerate mutase